MNVTENELEKRAVAPRVTLEYLEAQIASEDYYFHGTLTFCVLTMKNGFLVTGESACADPANFQADIGKRLARQQAVNKIWPLLGYELRTKLTEQKAEPKPEGTWLDRLKVEEAELRQRVERLNEYLLSKESKGISYVDRLDLRAQIFAMEAYHQILTARLRRQGAR